VVYFWVYGKVGKVTIDELPMVDGINLAGMITPVLNGIVTI